MKILLVEDDIMLNEMINEYISSTGHVVTSVKTGNEKLRNCGNNYLSPAPARITSCGSPFPRESLRVVHW